MKRITNIEDIVAGRYYCILRTVHRRKYRELVLLLVDDVLVDGVLVDGYEGVEALSSSKGIWCYLYVDLYKNELYTNMHDLYRNKRDRQTFSFALDSHVNKYIILELSENEVTDHLLIHFV